jgi:hypothetical protein
MRFVPKCFYNRLETSMPLTDPVKKKQFVFWENELTGRRRLFKLLPEDEAGFPRVWAVTDIRRCAGRRQGAACERRQPPLGAGCRCRPRGPAAAHRLPASAHPARPRPAGW